jgi:hypothetical protein
LSWGTTDPHTRVAWEANWAGGFRAATGAVVPTPGRSASVATRREVAELPEYPELPPQPVMARVTISQTAAPGRRMVGPILSALHGRDYPVAASWALPRSTSAT